MRPVRVAPLGRCFDDRRITALLRDAGSAVNKRVARIWRREGLNVPSKQPNKGRLWLAAGSCIQARENKVRVWTLAVQTDAKLLYVASCLYMRPDLHAVLGLERRP